MAVSWVPDFCTRLWSRDRKLARSDLAGFRVLSFTERSPGREQFSGVEKRLRLAKQRLSSSEAHTSLREVACTPFCSKFL